MNADEERASNEERLQRYLARAGVASRRASEQLITQGRVAVNGETVTALGTKVRPGDAVTVDGRLAVVRDELVYYALNKPPGYVTTVSDPWGRPTVMRLVTVPRRVFPVGRLDADSEGLLLLTNDGQLAFRLTHPRFGVDKEYQTLVRGSPSEEALQKLRRGVDLEGRKTAPARVERIRAEGNATWLRVTIHEGRKRQVRRMMASVGHEALRLVRTRFGPVLLGDLASGALRELTPAEVEALRVASVHQ